MALKKNRKAITAILGEISSRVIGQHHSGFTCGCGAVHADPGIVTEIKPAGDSYPGQEVLWSIWSVQVRYHPEDPNNLNGFGCGLSEFIPAEELDAIFAKHFGRNPNTDNPFKLSIAGEKRVHARLPVAVRIQENDHQVRFSFDWGNDQAIASALNEIEKDLTFHRSPNGSGDFEKIFDLLVKIMPTVYVGGPEPELPFESTWHTDYGKALAIAKNTDHVFLQCGGSYADHRGHVQTNGDVVFMKYHLD